MWLLRHGALLLLVICFEWLTFSLCVPAEGLSVTALLAAELRLQGDWFPLAAAAQGELFASLRHESTLLAFSDFCGGERFLLLVLMRLLVPLRALSPTVLFLALAVGAGGTLVKHLMAFSLRSLIPAAVILNLLLAGLSGAWFILLVQLRLPASGMITALYIAAAVLVPLRATLRLGFKPV